MLKTLALNRIVIMVVTALATNVGIYLTSAYPAVQQALCGGG